MAIVVTDLAKAHGSRVLFEDVTVTFSEGVNYGLTGPNGCGKSTFMKLLIGAEESTKGTVSIPARTAWLRQDHSHFDAYRVLDVVIMGNKRLWAALEEKERLYAKADFTDEDGERVGELEGVVLEEDGYTAEAEAATLLAGLGIEEALHDKPLSMLQGGLKLRVLLAQALFGKPDALLLDEPTNHLDIETIRWLEDFLLRYKGVLIVISHDRRFLNAVCDQIADIDYNTVILYPGNYDDMVRQKAQVSGRIARENAAKEAKISQLRDFIARFAAGTRSSQTRSRARQIEKLKPEEVKASNIQRPFIRFPIAEGAQSGRDVLAVEGLSKSYPDHPIFSRFSCHLQKGDRVAVLGRNGIGKTTLLKVLMGELAPDGGKVTWGHNVNIGVFSQSAGDEVAPGFTVLSWLRSHKMAVDEQTARGILGQLLFRGLDVDKPTAGLSGGERARLMMAKLVLMGHNVLVLDEPTNHLDLESISALGEGLAAYQGTLIFVTHDRDLAASATRIWAYPEEGRLVDYTGSLDEYLEWWEKQRAKAGGGR